jgi:hypothetical protein
VFDFLFKKNFKTALEINRNTDRPGKQTFDDFAQESVLKKNKLFAYVLCKQLVVGFAIVFIENIPVGRAMVKRCQNFRKEVKRPVYASVPQNLVDIVGVLESRISDGF